MTKELLPPEERPTCRVCPNPCEYYQPSRGAKRLRLYCSQGCAESWEHQRKREREKLRKRVYPPRPSRIDEADKKRVREMVTAARSRKPDTLSVQQVKLYDPTGRSRANAKKMAQEAAERRSDREAGRYAYTLIQDRRYPGDIRYALAVEPVRITNSEIAEVLKWKGIVLEKFGAEAFARMVNKAGRIPKCGGRFPNKEFGGERYSEARRSSDDEGNRLYVPTNKERRAFGLPEIDLSLPGRIKDEEFHSSGTYAYWTGTLV